MLQFNMQNCIVSEDCKRGCVCLCPAGIVHVPLVCKAAPLETESGSLLPSELLEALYLGLSDRTVLMTVLVQISACFEICNIHLPS